MITKKRPLPTDNNLVHLCARRIRPPITPNATSAIKRMVKPLVGTLSMSYNIDYVNLERGSGVGGGGVMQTSVRERKSVLSS